MHARVRSFSISLNCSLFQGIFRIFCEKRTQHKIDDSHYVIEDVQFTGNNLYILNSYSRKHFMLGKYFLKIYFSNHFSIIAISFRFILLFYPYWQCSNSTLLSFVYSRNIFYFEFLRDAISFQSAIHRSRYLLVITWFRVSRFNYMKMLSFRISYANRNITLFT